MARAFLTSIDLTQNEILNAVIQNLATAPSDPVEGQIYCNTADHNIYIWLNGAWETWVNAALLGAASGVATLNASSLVVQNPANATTTPTASKIPLANASNKIDNGWLNTGTGNGLDADTVDGQHGSYYLARANHSGTQAASTISDFATEVVKSRLDQMAAPTASVSLNSQKITNLATPDAGTDAANKDYVDSVSQGLDPKPSVMAATTGNITLSGAQTIDGIGVVAGNRVLVKNQSTPSENGIYTVQTGAWTRTSDADTWAELTSAYVFIEKGSTLADSGWLCSIDSGGTLGSTDVTWVQFSQAGSVTGSNVGTGALGFFKQKNGTTLEFYSIDDTTSIDVIKTGDVLTFAVLPAGVNINSLGNGPLSVANGGTNATTAAAARTNLGATGKFAAMMGNGADTVFTITHSLNSTDVIIQVRKTNSPLSVVEPDLEVVDANNVKVTFAVAPSTDQYRVIVIG